MFTTSSMQLRALFLQKQEPYSSTCNKALDKKQYNMPLSPPYLLLVSTLHFCSVNLHILLYRMRHLLGCHCNGSLKITL